MYLCSSQVCTVCVAAGVDDFDAKVDALRCNSCLQCFEQTRPEDGADLMRPTVALVYAKLAQLCPSVTQNAKPAFQKARQELKAGGSENW